MSKPINHLEYLCYYDPRNPDYLPPLDGDAPREPRTNCSCDNCFYGRDRLALRIIELETELSRYRSGVEVEGLVFKHAELLDESLAQFNGQRVRVLVIPEDRIVDANKTMKGVE